MGIKSSFRIAMAKTAIIAPIDKLPVSPIKTCAGYVLYHRKPIHAPIKAAAKTTNSPELGMYIISR